MRRFLTVRWLAPFAMAVALLGGFKVAQAFIQAANGCVTLAPDAGLCLGVQSSNTGQMKLQNNDSNTVCYGYNDAGTALCAPLGGGTKIASGDSATTELPPGNTVCVWSAAGTIDGGLCWAETWH